MNVCKFEIAFHCQNSIHYLVSRSTTFVGMKEICIDLYYYYSDFKLLWCIYFETDSRIRIIETD